MDTQIVETPQVDLGQEKKKKRRTMWGIILIAAPFVCLPITLSLYAITTFIFGSLMGVGETSRLIASIVKVLLSLAGLLSIIAIPVGIPFGIYLLVKKD